MAETRADRIARNEARFRELNAELERGLSSLQRDPDERAAFVCECGTADCSQMVKLPLDDYKRVHVDDMRFVVLPGHEAGGVERVVEEHDGWNVVEKLDVDDVPEIVGRG